MLGDKWKALNEKDRKPYEDKAKKDKERYEEEKIAYQNVCHLPARDGVNRADTKQKDEDEEESS